MATIQRLWELLSWPGALWEKARREGREMTLRGYTVKEPINILAEDEVKRIHSGTLEVLEDTGVVFEHKKALEILEGAGCKVDFERQRVRFPSSLVEESIRKCPSSFTIRTRERKNYVRMGGHTLYFSSMIGMDTLDVDTGARRAPTVQDTIEAVRVIDALDEIHFCTAPYFNLKGVPPVMVFPTLASIITKNSSKATITPTGYDVDIWCIKMAQATDQEMPGNATSAPPLTWGEDIITSTLRYIEAGFPIVPISGLNFGANAPATIAGSLVLNNAELLSCIVLTQAVSPGHRCLAANYSQPLEMRTCQPILGAIEKGICGMGFAQMWRHYGIPSLHFVSSDAKVPDYQCGYEKAMSLLIQSLAGYSLLSCPGVVYDELLHSPIVTVMDADILGMIGRILEGIEVTDETLAVDLIKQVGPIPGHYLNTAHTRKWWKHELFMPALADKLSHPEWEKAGSKNIVERAKERVKEILATHKPTPLPEEQEKAIDEILKEATSYFKERGML
jgi:trimethylamine--corrinoid protein Co-methyltransferase